jgi:hypothetical protein
MTSDRAVRGATEVLKSRGTDARALIAKIPIGQSAIWRGTDSRERRTLGCRSIDRRHLRRQGVQMRDRVETRRSKRDINSECTPMGDGNMHVAFAFVAALILIVLSIIQSRSRSTSNLRDFAMMVILATLATMYTSF